MRTLIIPDLHGRLEVLEDIIFEVGDGYDKIIQLGDAIHGGFDWGQDMNTWDALQDLGATVLVGNHEFAFLVKMAAFSGWDNKNPVGAKLRNAMRQSHSFIPAAMLDGVLLTHAGVGKCLGFQDIYSAHDAIVDAWHDLRNGRSSTGANDIFRAVGYARGGMQEFGGVLWRDDSEPLEQSFPQVYGHTPQSLFLELGEKITTVHEVPMHNLDYGVGRQISHYAWGILEDGVLTITCKRRS